MVEAAFPVRAPLGQPVGGRGNCGRIQPAGPDAPDLLRLDEAALLEHLKVLHDGRQGYWERLGEARDGDGSRAETLQDVPARRVAERVENAAYIGFSPRHEASVSEEIG